MKEKKLVIFLILIGFLILIININLVGKTNSIIEIREIDASLIVAENTGFDLDNKILSFGKVMPGSSATRQVELENNYGEGVIIRVYARGEIKKFVNSFRIELEKDEVKETSIAVNIPIDAKFGEYNGKIFIEARRK